MLASAPSWIWIIISALSIPVVIVLIIKAIKGGLKVGKDGIEFLGSDRNEQPKNTRATIRAKLIRKNEIMLAGIFESLADLIRKHMVHDLNISKDHISENIDYKFVTSLIWQVVWGQNGRHSVRTVVEDAIKHEDYNIPTTISAERQIEARRSVMTGIIDVINYEMKSLFDNKYDDYFEVYVPAYIDDNGKHRREQNLKFYHPVTRAKIAELFEHYTRNEMATKIEALLFEGA
jgi:hypothetical protein